MGQPNRHYEPIYEGRRSSSRLRVQLPAKLVLLDRTTDCIVDNISQAGARLIVEKPPELGEFGRIRSEVLDAFFDTVWHEGTRVGVLFDEPMSHAELIALRQYHDGFSELEKARILKIARSWVMGEPE